MKKIYSLPNYRAVIACTMIKNVLRKNLQHKDNATSGKAGQLGVACSLKT